MTRKSIIWILFTSMVVIASCVNHELELPLDQYVCGPTISYTNDIAPLVVNRCALDGCHDGSLGEDRNWLIPSTFKAHAAEAKRRTMLPPGHADHMPKDGTTLPDEDIIKIACWFDQKAPIDN
jgi:hypothetical protein